VRPRPPARTPLASSVVRLHQDADSVLREAVGPDWTPAHLSRTLRYFWDVTRSDPSALRAYRSHLGLRATSPAPDGSDGPPRGVESPDGPQPSSLKRQRSEGSAASEQSAPTALHPGGGPPSPSATA